MVRTGRQRAQSYERAGHGLSGDVAYYVGLARAGAAPVLELGCGTGRVTLAVARAGVPVVGLDHDPDMLALAQQKAAGLDNPRWVLADMCSFTLSSRFGLVTVPYRGLQTLPDESAVAATIAVARRHLVPGGRLAFNIANVPALAVRLSDAQGRRVGRWRGGLLPLEPGRVRQMLGDAGFAVEGLHGGFLGEPFLPDSSEQVWLASVSAAGPR